MYPIKQNKKSEVYFLKQEKRLSQNKIEMASFVF